MISYWCLAFVTGVMATTTLGNPFFAEDFSLLDECPFTDFCTMNATISQNGNTTTPCCVSCLCTADCHLHGNCCPDVQNPADDNLPKPVCYFPVFNADMKTLKRKKNKYFTGINSYNTFIACPTTFTDVKVRDLCEKSPKDLTSFTMVSDQSGYVYRNKYCAECHGKTKYLDWKIQIRCPTTKYESKIKTGHSLETFKPCMVWSLPPESTMSSKSLCYDAIDACNVTGEMQTYDAILNYKCESFTLYYIYTFGKVSVLFKNVYCYLCNKNTHVASTICPTDLQYLRNDLVVEFTGILNKASFSSMFRPVKPRCRKRCLKWQMYDPLFNTCRKLTCQAGSKSFYGDCLNIFDSTFGYSLSMLIDLRPVLNHSRNPDIDQVFFNYPDNYNDMIRFIKAVAMSTNQFKNKCSFCNGMLLDGGNSTNKYLKVLLTFHTNRVCDINTLYKSAYDYGRSHARLISFNVQQQKIWYKSVVNIDLTSEVISEIHFNNKVTHLEKIVGEPKPFRGEIACPKITLNETEYSIFLNQTRQVVPVKRNIHFEEINGLKESVEEIAQEVDGKVDGKSRRKARFDFDICSHHYIMAVGGSDTLSNDAFTLLFIFYVNLIVRPSFSVS